MPLKGTPTWRLHTKPYKFGLNVYPNISHMNYRTDLILSEAFCIFIFFLFPDSEFSVFLVCRDKAAILRVKTTEFFLEQFT